MAIIVPQFLLGLPASVAGAIESTGAAPEITSDGGGATADVSVNTGDTAVTTVVASDTGTITYSIVGGAEALMFEIDPDSGELAFTETSVDGEYEVIVAATSDWGQDRQTITVTVEEVYHAGAVHFDTDTFLSRDQPLVLTGVVDAPTGVYMLWIKANNAISWLVQSQASNSVVINENSGILADDNSDNFASPDWDGDLTDNTWRQLLMSWDLTTGAQIVQVYISDVARMVTNNGSETTVSINYEDQGWSFALVGGNPFDVSDFLFFAGGSFVDLSVEANRRKFISAEGKPVDPAVAIAAFGTPAIMFSGDATTYATNQAPTGAFVLAGTALTNASTSPSD